MSTPLLAAKLVELRQSKGLSQKDLADYLGVSREAYSNYERAIREPNLEIIFKLSKFYGINVSELVNERTVLSGMVQRSHMLSDMPLGGIAARAAALQEESTITRNMNHLLKLLTGKNSGLDLTAVTKADIAMLASYKALDDETQREVREFIKFKHSLNKAK